MGKTALILGGAGALGQGVVTSFKRHGWRLLSLDLAENTQADSNFLISGEKRLQD
jgi:NAD(P)-dependent dehydrogenase (short-subunit alcohol dehydrogenase family)